MRGTAAHAQTTGTTGHRSTQDEKTFERPLTSGAERRLGTSEIEEQQRAVGSEYRRRLWGTQAALWSVTKVKSLAGCHRWRAPGARDASLQWRGEGSARWASLQDSHSVWGSPVSAANIQSLRTAETTTAIQNWTEEPGHSVQFLTLTLRHRKSQGLTELWDALSYCWKGVTGTAAWRGGVRSVGDKAEFGIEHFVKSVEVTVGKNGWHVHIHALLLTHRRLAELELVKLRGRIFERWSRAAERRGLDAPSDEHGVDLRQAATGQDAEDVAGYVAKGMAQSLGGEVSGGLGKIARKGSRTPFQVLEDIGLAQQRGGKPEVEDVALWHVWEKESKGRRQMTWSKGAKDSLGIADLTDEELVEAGEAAVESWTIAKVEPDEWRKVQSKVDVRLEVVEAVSAARTAEEAVKLGHEVLVKLGIGHQVCMVSDQEVEDRCEDREMVKERSVRAKLGREEAWREGLRKALDLGKVKKPVPVSVEPAFVQSVLF